MPRKRRTGEADRGAQDTARVAGHSDNDLERGRRHAAVQAAAVDARCMMTLS
jgi:hypothetical protein